jgi:ParB family chromosome partitioning protein
LSPIVQAGIKDRMISMGHAKSLVTIENEDEQEKLYMHIIAENLTVRDVELLVKSTKTPSSKRKNIVTQPLPFSYQQLIKQFEEKSSLKSAIKLHKNGKGKLLIDFNSEDELEQLIKCFKFDS